MTAIVPPVKPGAELERGRRAVFNLEDLINKIDRGAHAVVAIGTSAHVDPKAVRFLGDALTDLASTLREEWAIANDLLQR